MQYTLGPFSIVLYFLWFKYRAFQLSENPNCSLVISSNNFYAYFTQLAPPLKAVCSASSHLDHLQKKFTKWRVIVWHLNFRHLAGTTIHKQRLGTYIATRSLGSTGSAILHPKTFHPSYPCSAFQWKEWPWYGDRTQLTLTTYPNFKD